MATSMTVGRFQGWIRRYALAEVSGLAAALLAAAVSMAIWPHGLGQAAVAAAVGEGVGFYAAFVWRQMRARRHLLAAGWLRQVVIVLGGLLVEFGPAELIDTLLVRPLAMYGMELAFGSIMLGVVAGKLIADVVFYGLAVGAYELILRRLRGFGDAAVAGARSTGLRLAVLERPDAAPALLSLMTVPALAGQTQRPGAERPRIPRRPPVARLAKRSRRARPRARRSIRLAF